MQSAQHPRDPKKIANRASRGIAGEITSALTHSDDTGSLSILAKIEAADAFQTKGFGSALCSVR